METEFVDTLVDFVCMSMDVYNFLFRYFYLIGYSGELCYPSLYISGY